MFRKKTHTDSYLHAESYHHPAQKFGVLNILVVIAQRISNVDHVKDEINHLTSIFRGIGYKEKEIRKTIKRAESLVIFKRHQGPQESCGRIFLPYIKGVTDNIAKVSGSNEISRILQKQEQ